MQSTQLALSHVGEISPDLLTEVWSLAESCMAFVCSNTKALQVIQNDSSVINIVSVGFHYLFSKKSKGFFTCLIL